MHQLLNKIGKGVVDNNKKIIIYDYSEIGTKKTDILEVVKIISSEISIVEIYQDRRFIDYKNINKMGFEIDDIQKPYKWSLSKNYLDRFKHMDQSFDYIYDVGSIVFKKEIKE